MRKTLLAVGVAAALFTVGAFAASFTVRSDDIASGENSVVACAAKVDIKFAAPTYADGVWKVASATATFYDGDNPAVVSTKCNGGNAQLAVTSDPGGATTYAATGPVAAGIASFTITGGLPVGPIKAASVAVNGVFVS